MKTILFLMTGLILSIILCCSSGPTQFRKFAESSYREAVEFDPVWANGIGIHDYDGMLPDYSDEAIARRDAMLRAELDSLMRYDTTGWSIDDQIDYRIQLANLEYTTESCIEPYSPASFINDIEAGIVSIVMSENLAFTEKTRAFNSILREIPKFLQIAEYRITTYPHEDYLCASILREPVLEEHIKKYTDVIIDSIPELNAEISTNRDKAIIAIKTFIADTGARFKSAYEPEQWDNGKELNRTIKNAFFIDFDIDSVLVILENQYNYAYSLYRYYSFPHHSNNKNADYGENFFETEIDKRTEAYYLAQIDTLIIFLNENNILTVSADYPHPQLKQFPRYLMYNLNSLNCLIVPGYYDDNQIATLFIEGALQKPFEDIDDTYKLELRDVLLTKVVPGYYLQNYLSSRNKPVYRTVTDDTVQKEIWSLYIKEYMYGSGVMGENREAMDELYSEIRDYAMAAIIEINMNLGKYDFAGAYKQVEERYGIEEAKNFKQTSWCSCINPAGNLSVILGRYLILDMRQKAQAKEGRNFSIKRFHDCILSEGDVPIPLIAWKYGWQ